MGMDIEDWEELLKHVRETIVESGACVDLSLIAVIKLHNGNVLVMNATPEEMQEITVKSVYGLAEMFSRMPDLKRHALEIKLTELADLKERLERELKRSSENTPTEERPEQSKYPKDVMEMARKSAEMLKEQFLQISEERGIDSAKQNLIVSAVGFSHETIKEFRRMNIPQRVEWVGTLIADTPIKWKEMWPDLDVSWWPEITDRDIELVVRNMQ